MANRIDYQYTFLGRVKEIVIDGTSYPVFSDGVNITHAARYNIKPVVGDYAPRARVAEQYYKIDAVLAENKIGSLKLAWNLPGDIALTATTRTLQLGVVQSLTARTLQVTGWIYGGNNVQKQRRYIFTQVCLFEPKPQVHAPGAIVTIPVSFYAYGSADLTSGSEFGSIVEDI